MQEEVAGPSDYSTTSPQYLSFWGIDVRAEGDCV